MSLNNTPTAERLHIGFFGLRNAGKSSVVNAVTAQNLSVVSPVLGTTTDPVKKAMELLPLGPVVIVDTPGIDDDGALGAMRVEKAKQVLKYTDICVLVVDSLKGLQADDRELIETFKKNRTDFIIAYNKSDLLEDIPESTENEIYVSAVSGYNIDALKNMLAAMAKDKESNKKIVADLIFPNDFAVLCVPIDESAPKGRLILPQQQVIRELLDSGAVAVVTRDTEFSATLTSLSKKPRLVITDSQAFGKISKQTPADIPLTSFSILFARYKGNLVSAVHGAAQLDRLSDGDTILICEGCTHHRQCNDIGTVKMPAWVKKHCQKDVSFDFTSGGDFPEDLSKYALIIHCGGCMLNQRQMQSRALAALGNNVPMTNYGIAIAHMNGILKRSVELFPEALAELE